MIDENYPANGTVLTFNSEPDSLANLVTNMAVSKCANAHDAYLEGTDYAVKQLNLDNVAMYLDAGKQSFASAIVITRGLSLKLDLKSDP